MGNSQFSLLRQVIEGQAEPQPGEVPAVPPAAAPDVSKPHPVPGAPVVPRSSISSTADTLPPAAAPKGGAVGPSSRTAAHSGHMKLLFDNAPVAMAMFDTDMRYLLANRRWLEDFKLTKIDITGRSQYDLFPSLHPGWRHVYNRALGGQVVRSDRDSITQDGKRVVYRWEVRPWRHMDTTIGGVTISCERLYQGGPPASVGGDAGDKSAAQQHEGIWKTKMPLLALTDKGGILRVSEGLAASVPGCSNEEEPVFFWDAFAEPDMHAPLRRATLVALDAVLGGSEPQASIFTYTAQGSQGVPAATPPIQWLVSRLGAGLPGVEGAVALVVGLHGAVPPAKAEPRANDTAPVAGSQEWDQFVAEIARLRQAHKEASDAATLSLQRETRLRAVLELAPCGLMVIDEHACAIYQNAQVPGLLGRAVPDGQPMHDWLAEGARDDLHRHEVVRLWTEEIWRKRSTVPVPLIGADGIHREVEMRPVPLPGGGLLLMLQDVTESRRSEEMLRSTEAKFRTLVHENPIPVVLADRSGGVVDVNPACEQLLGHTRAEMRRMSLERWLDLASLSQRAAVLEELTRRGERYAEFPVNVIHANGYVLPVQLRLAMVPDVSGQPMFTLHFFSPVEQPAVTSEIAPAPAPAPSEVPAVVPVEPAAAAEEEERPQAVPSMKSAALADAAALMKTFAPVAKAPEEPAPIAPAAEIEVQQETLAPTTIEEVVPEPVFSDVTVAGPPAADAPPVVAAAAPETLAPEPAVPDVSPDVPYVSEPPPATLVSSVLPDPWIAPAPVPAHTSNGSHHAAPDPWSVPQPAAVDPVVAADPWRAPQVQAFAPPAPDPWAAPQPPPPVHLPVYVPVEGLPPAAAVHEAEAVATPLPEAVVPPATTPVHEELPPIEEIPAAAPPAQEQEPKLESEPMPVPALAPVNASRSVALLSTDVHGRITAWTGDAEIRFGFSPGEMLGRGLHSLFRPSDSTGLHIEILTLPGWASSVSSAVVWQFFHKQDGRQEATFTLIPLEQGGLSLILQEEHLEAVASSEPMEPTEPISPPASPEQFVPEPASVPVVEPPAQQTEVLEPVISLVEPVREVPSYEVPQPTAALEPLAAVPPEPVPEPEAALDVGDDMAPPPPLLDDLDAPDEWPGVPANLLEDNLPPIVQAPTEPSLPSIFDRVDQTFAAAGPAMLEPQMPATSVETPAPLSLAPPQRMFADIPPVPPKPLSLAPPQSLYKDATAAAAVEASLAMASKPPAAPENPPSPPVPLPDPVPAVEPNAAPSVAQQRPSFEELQRERLLLGETHHRVKNHLQIITSMLNLQMSTLHNEEARDALRSSQNRVRSIAALHQHLYLLTTGESADFRAFATGLISHLRECYHVPKDRVSLMLHIPDRLLPEEWLMPLALALNEMVSNAFQHAWPDERSGSMSVTLTCGETPDGQPHGRLTVADDGIGLPPNFEHLDHPGMGMKILRVFAGQLGGEVKTRVGSMQGRGVTFELVFPSAR